MPVNTYTSGAVLTAAQLNNDNLWSVVTGGMQMFGGAVTQSATSGVVTTTAPTGYLLCNGDAISRTTYAALFTVLGTTYGTGDGSTTFNLPNLKGRVPVGFDSTQTEFDAMGETGGAKTHTLATSEIPAHAHDIQRNNVAASSTGADASTVYRTLANTGATYTTTQTTGGGGAHNNLQPYITLNFIIKT
jgi:hypothetical protein